MFRKHQIFAIAFALLVAACGGGGGSSGSSSTSPSSTMSGVASAGSPIANGYISILSLTNGQIFTPTATTGLDGSFSLTIDQTAYPAPYIIRILGDGEKQTAIYSYVETATTGGLVVTPTSTAAISLAANASPEDVFAGRASLNKTQFLAAVEKLYAVASTVYSYLGIKSPEQLVNNTGYIADGSGLDAVQDLLSSGSTNSANGEVLVTTKFAGKSAKISSASSASSISSLNLNAPLALAITAQINNVNNCIKQASNLNDLSGMRQCLDSNFKDAGNSSVSTFLSNIRSYAGTIQRVNASNVRWCDFDNSNLNFSSPSNLLANQTGTCFARFNLITDAGASRIADGYYKFTVNSSGTGVQDVKLFGNQLDSELSVGPGIQLKRRFDGYSDNVNVVASGFQFNIGTGLGSSNQILPNSILSAKVELIGNSGNIGTFYMQCVQGVTCVDSELTVCTDNTCNNVDKTYDQIIGVDSQLATSIINELQAGPVRARITAYNGLLSNGSKRTIYTRTLPIIDLPVPQPEANQIVFPEIDSGSLTRLGAWAGESTLNISFTKGTPSLLSANFVVSPGAGIPSSEINLKDGATSATFSGIGVRNTPISPIVANCTSFGTWRGVYLYGIYRNVPVTTKYFGSCSQYDY